MGAASQAPLPAHPIKTYRHAASTRIVAACAAILAQSCIPAAPRHTAALSTTAAASSASATSAGAAAATGWGEHDGTVAGAAACVVRQLHAPTSCSLSRACVLGVRVRVYVPGARWRQWRFSVVAV